MEPGLDLTQLITIFMSKNYNLSKLKDMIIMKKTRIILSIDKLREFSQEIVQKLISKPIRLIKIFENILNELAEEAISLYNNEKSIINNSKPNNNKYKVGFEGNFGRNMISPRGLISSLTNQLVCVQGIVTRMSILRPKLSTSFHFCEETNILSVKEYNDQYSINQPTELGGEYQSMNFMSNRVPLKDNNNNLLSFEYGLSIFKDFQTLLIQEPPERTPVGQLPRSIETILEDDLVDRAKPGDRIQITGIFKCVISESSRLTGIFKTVLIAVDIHPINIEIEAPKLTGEDIKNIKIIANRPDRFKILSNSIAPSIFGHYYIKKGLILQILGGVEKNLENGTHLRGDINVLLIGDPSTAKSQVNNHINTISFYGIL
jgi:DNA replication licensing factor MCM3